MCHMCTTAQPTRSCYTARHSLRAVDIVTTEEDRKARRRKLGLPEELTEEEKAAEAAAAAQKAEAASKKKAAFVSVKPITGLHSMRQSDVQFVVLLSYCTSCTGQNELMQLVKKCSRMSLLLQKLVNVCYI